MNTLLQILINLMMSLMAFYTTLKVIPKVRQLFIRANLFGFDLCKNDNKSKMYLNSNIFLLLLLLLMIVIINVKIELNLKE
jgi:hypothetical protein